MHTRLPVWKLWGVHIGNKHPCLVWQALCLIWQELSVHWIDLLRHQGELEHDLQQLHEECGLSQSM